MPAYQVTNNDRTYPIEATDLAALDAHEVSPGKWHLLKDGTAYQVEILDLDPAAKTVTLSVNGRRQTLVLSDETDQLVKRLGFSVATAAKTLDAVAPMPGLVLDVMVKAGDEVTAGTPLLILEAMKMENVLKAEADGVVKAIKVSKGEAVEKKQLLVEIE